MSQGKLHGSMIFTVGLVKGTSFAVQLSLLGAHTWSNTQLQFTKAAFTVPTPNTPTTATNKNKLKHE